MKVENHYFPDDMLYTDTHLWVRLENGKAKVGLTSLGQSLSKGITHIDLPSTGQIIRRNEDAASFESIKAVIKVSSPLSGKILEVNSSLMTRPEYINKDPYGDGWLFSLEIKDPSELKMLKTVKEASSFLKKFIRKEREKYA